MRYAIFLIVILGCTSEPDVQHIDVAPAPPEVVTITKTVRVVEPCPACDQCRAKDRTIAEWRAYGEAMQQWLADQQPQQTPQTTYTTRRWRTRRQ